ncbi:hypothetical protein EON63_18770 [archaeon]|nr:MAG: hypothetical protein EON63_18770 [archaeon]
MPYTTTNPFPGPPGPDGTPLKLEYRVWNPFRSKLAAAILGGVDHIHMPPGSKVCSGYMCAIHIRCGMRVHHTQHLHNIPILIQAYSSPSYPY